MNGRPVRHLTKVEKLDAGGAKESDLELHKTRVFTKEGRRRLSILRLGKPSWNKGIKRSVPGGGSKESTWRPTPEQ